MPKIELQSALPPGLAIGAFLGIVALLILYWLWTGSLPHTLRRWVIALRASFLMIIILLLLDPRIEWTRNVLVPPRIGIMLDNSLSMANHPGASPTTVLSQAASVIEWADELDYQPVIMTFGEALTSKSDLLFEYQPNERITDFSPLRELFQTGELQAAFIFSDGVATSGMDPNAIMGSSRTPVYTVGVGDTSTGLDLAILEVTYPLSLLDQEQSEIQIAIRGTDAQNKRSRLYIYQGGQLFHSEQIDIPSRDHTRIFEVPVVGRLDAPKFRVELMVLPEEANIDNNQREFQIEVLPGRRQITIITGALNPNTSLVGQIAEQTRNTMVNHLIFLRGAWQGDESGFWSMSQDLVVLDNYPTTTLPSEHLDRMLDKLNREGTPVVVVEGPDNTNREFIRMMRSLGLQVTTEDEDTGFPLSRLIPVPQPGLTRLQGTISGRYADDFAPVALVHTLDPQLNSSLAALVVDEQQRVVIGFTESSGIKRSILLLPALSSTNLKLNRTAWRGYIPDVLQAIVEWELEPEGFSPYVIKPDRQQYHLGEKVLLRGIVRDRAGERILQPILTLEVQGPESSTLATMIYNFESGEYEGEYWPGEAGSYSLKIYNEEESNSELQQAFQVQIGRVELQSLVQNRYGLERLAQTTGGQYADLPSVEQLLMNQSYTSKIVDREYYITLWQFRYLMLVAVLLLGLEWILRRIAGFI